MHATNLDPQDDGIPPLDPDVETLLRGLLVESIVEVRPEFNDPDDSLIHLFSLQIRLRELATDPESSPVPGGIVLAAERDQLLEAAQEYLEACYLDDALLQQFAALREGVGYRPVADPVPLRRDGPTIPPPPDPSDPAHHRRRAREEARQIVALASDDADRILVEARQQAEALATQEVQRQQIQDDAQQIIAKADLEATRTLEAARRQASELAALELARREAEASQEADRLIAIATAHAERILEEAHREAAESAAMEALRLHSDAWEEAQQLVTSANEAAERSMAEARQQAEIQATREAARILAEAEEQARQLVAKAAASTEQVRVQAREMALPEMQQIISKAKDRVRAIEAAAIDKARQLLAEAERKAAATPIANPPPPNPERAPAGEKGASVQQQLAAVLARLDELAPRDEAPKVFYRLGKLLEEAGRHRASINPEALLAAALQPRREEPPPSLLSGIGVPEAMGGVSGELITLFQSVALLIDRLADKAPGLLTQLNLPHFFGGMFDLYPYIGSGEEADRVVAVYLSDYLGQLVRHLQSLPFLSEEMATMLAMIGKTRREVMKRLNLRITLVEPSPQPDFRPGLLLNHGCKHLRSLDQSLRQRQELEYVPGLITAKGLVSVSVVVEKIFTQLPPPTLAKHRRNATAVFRLFRDASGGTVNWPALMGNGPLGSNFIQSFFRDLLNTDELRQALVTGTVRNLRDHYPERSLGDLTDEARLIQATLIQSQAEREIWLFALNRLARLCFTPEAEQRLQGNGATEWEHAVRFAFYQPDYLEPLNLADGDLSPWLRTSLAKSQLDEMHAILKSLAPADRELCVLQLLHRRILSFDTLEKWLRLWLKERKTTIQESMPSLARELMGRFRFRVGQSYLEKNGLQERLIPDAVQARLAPPKTLLISLGFNNPQDSEEERNPIANPVDAVLAAPELLDELRETTLHWAVEPAAGGIRALFGAGMGLTTKKKPSSTIQLRQAQLTRLGFAREARLVMQVATEEARAHHAPRKEAWEEE